jgi:hypothetical protein
MQKNHWWVGGYLTEQVDGYTQVYGKNFTFASVRASGHLVPQDQPARALTLFKGFLSGKPLVKFVPVGLWMPSRLSFCFHTGVGSLEFWRPTKMYESGLGFKVLFGCPGEPLYYHHHMLHTIGEQLGCDNFNQVWWGISLFPFMKYLNQTKKIWPGW